MLIETPVALDSCLIETSLILNTAAKILFLLSFGSFWIIIALILINRVDVQLKRRLDTGMPFRAWLKERFVIVTGYDEFPIVPKCGWNPKSIDSTRV